MHSQPSAQRLQPPHAWALGRFARARVRACGSSQVFVCAYARAYRSFCGLWRMCATPRDSTPLSNRVSHAPFQCEDLSGFNEGPKAVGAPRLRRPHLCSQTYCTSGPGSWGGRRVPNPRTTHPLPSLSCTSEQPQSQVPRRCLTVPRG